MKEEIKEYFSTLSQEEIRQIVENLYLGQNKEHIQEALINSILIENKVFINKEDFQNSNLEDKYLDLCRLFGVGMLDKSEILIEKIDEVLNY